MEQHGRKRRWDREYDERLLESEFRSASGAQGPPPPPMPQPPMPNPVRSASYQQSAFQESSPSISGHQMSHVPRHPGSWNSHSPAAVSPQIHSRYSAPLWTSQYQQPAISAENATHSLRTTGVWTPCGRTPQSGPFHTSSSPTLGWEEAERLAQHVQAKLAAGGECVGVLAVQSAMCQATGGAAGLEQLGLSTSGIPSLRQLGLKEEKVNVIIASLVSAQPICTLHDVEKQLAAEEGVASFAELGLGPLLKQPLVQSLFQPATDLKAVPSITGLEVVMQLEEHMATNEKQARSGAPMARSWKRVEAVR
ncbi:hypothetical protein CYMTET_13808 [Cymbomonas tetramitiformis]|uniref:Uncharacterized protein n=1 Tax=Cymbomonas tetramitiformis TaxID=36881 RepID=A0AAE0GHX2_9CHLO|nr:hypothetical protein CYMTET_13808 [Cymbomonas tetramitiformis]